MSAKNVKEAGTPDRLNAFFCNYGACVCICVCLCVCVCVMGHKELERQKDKPFVNMSAFVFVDV